MKNEYKFPLQNEGNIRNPKLVILLNNPGGSCEHIEWLPEYTMNLEGKYKDSGIKIKDFCKYSQWWHNLIEPIIKQTDFKYNDICGLEFYPYHTKQSNKIPKQEQWDAYAKKCKKDNIKLLKKFIKQNAFIFGYYYGAWEGDEDIQKDNTIQNLNKYAKYHKSIYRFPAAKRKELLNFVKKKKSKTGSVK